jgi:hypothetical protein
VRTNKLWFNSYGNLASRLVVKVSIQWSQKDNK